LQSAQKQACAPVASFVPMKAAGSPQSWPKVPGSALMQRGQIRPIAGLTREWLVGKPKGKQVATIQAERFNRKKEAAT
jgi:hypothetical protein